MAESPTALDVKRSNLAQYVRASGLLKTERRCLIGWAAWHLPSSGSRDGDGSI